MSRYGRVHHRIYSASRVKGWVLGKVYVFKLYADLFRDELWGFLRVRPKPARWWFGPQTSLRLDFYWQSESDAEPVGAGTGEGR